MRPGEAREERAAEQTTSAIVVGSPAGDIVALRAEDGMILWIFPTPPVWSTLASSGEVIYLGTHPPSRVNRRHPAQVTALRVQDGTVLWQAAPKELQGPTALAVDSNRVFAVSSGLNRAVFALDAQTGAARWITPDMRGCGFRLVAGWNAFIHWAALTGYFSLDQTIGTYRLLAARGGAVYLDAGTISRVHALDTRTGKERWRSGKKHTPLEATASDTRVYLQADTPQGLVIAVLRAADGTLEHTLPLQRGRDRPLVISEQGIVYLVRGAQICALRVSDAEPIWCTSDVWEGRSAPGDVAARACLSDHALSYYTIPHGPGGLRVGALDRETGKKVWEWQSDERLARAGNAVSIVAGHGNVYVATLLGLFAFRERDGHLLWHALSTTDLSFIDPVLTPAT